MCVNDGRGDVYVNAVRGVQAHFQTKETDMSNIMPCVYACVKRCARVYAACGLCIKV